MGDIEQVHKNLLGAPLRHVIRAENTAIIGTWFHVTDLGA